MHDEPKQLAPMRSGRALRVLAGAVASKTAYHPWIAGKATGMEPMSEYAQLQLRFVDSIQRRYEVIRPIILLGERTAAQQAEETQLHPETVRDLTAVFGSRACWGSCRSARKSLPSRGKGVSEKVLEELARLKALYDGFGYRELARILWHQTHEGFVANFAQEVIPGQLPLSVRRLGGESVELFGRSAALFSLLDHYLPFLIMCMSSMPTNVSCAASNALNPNIGRVIHFTPRWSCSTILLRYFTLRMSIAVPWSSS